MNLRQFKPVYWLYNLLHYKELKHNKEAYKRYNIHKPLISSISSKDFPDKESRAWLDAGDSALLASTKRAFHQFAPEVQGKLVNWSKNGFLVLENFFNDSVCDDINLEIEKLLRDKKIKFTYGNKLMFAYKRSAVIKKMINDPLLKNILGFILDKEVIPFQTINFLHGSQQRAHSDSIHMTTYPLGYLVAAWVALEDVSADNGPLFYFPGSHKLPYLLNNDFNEGETSLTLGKKDYTDYEDVLEASVAKHNFQPKEFHARKGDVFVWHANLIHGGSPINNKALTRKSMVIHYFASDVIKYHEITERPSLI